MCAQKLVNRVRDKRDGVHLGLGVGLEHPRHFSSFVYNGWNEEIAYQQKEEKEFKEGYECCRYASLQLQQVAGELYRRLKDIGDEASDEEREKDTFQRVNEPDGTEKQHAVYDEPHCAVKCVRLS